MIMPPMANIITRKNMALAGDNFMEWASDYFSEDSDHLNVKLVKDDVFEDCRAKTNAKNLSSHTFTKKLKAFVAVADWIVEFNPQDVPGYNNGRIISDSVVYIYLKSKDAPF